MNIISEKNISYLKNLYEADEHKWLWENVKLLDQERVDEIDHKHIKEFLEDMAKRDQREVYSRLKVLLMHLLKWKYQPAKRTNSWKITIMNQRDDLNFDFNASKTLKNYGKEQFNKTYKKARLFASTETGFDVNTFPEKPPFSFEVVVDDNFFPD